MVKLIKMFRDRISTKLGVLGKEVSMSILGFFFLFIAISFFFNMQTNKYFLFFVWAYGILTFFFFVPLLKHGFNSKNEIISTQVENSRESINTNILNIKETEFRDFFLEGKFDDLLKLCIQNNLINSDSLEWQKEATHFAVLYHKLKKNNYLKVDKKKYTQKYFATFAKKIFKIDSLDDSLFSHYKPGNTTYFTFVYEEFYNKTLNFIGNE
jgi:hypothetical protein